MPRGYSAEIRYRRNRTPIRWNRGKKVQSDYTAWTYEELLATDDYGNRFDTRTETPDLNLGPGVLGGRSNSF